jgi:glutathione S-transferase
MLEVYLDPATINSRKVLAGLELVGMPYHVNHVNYFAGAHKQSPYIDLNPNGVLPAAKDGNPTRSCSTRPT